MTAILPPVRVFISYPHKDAADHDELVSHLGGLVLDGTLEICDDRQIRAGANWRDKLQEFLEQADIILLLVSNEFVGSKECQKETEIALQLLEAGKVRVIPVLIRQVHAGSRLGRLQFLPGNGPVPSAGEARDAAFTEIARKIQEVALEIRTAAPRAEEKGAVDLTGKWNSLALRLADQGHPREALEILEEAIGIHRNQRTEDFAALLSNRGLVRQDLGDLEGARQDLEQAWEISEEILGPDHPVVARRLAHFGGVLLDLGKDEKARAMLERALVTLEMASEPWTPDLLITCLHLGDALEAEPRRARDLLERLLAEDSGPRAAAAAHSTLGRIAFRQGRFPDALNHFRQAVEIGERSHKRGHIFVGMDLHNLGLTQWALGRMDKARGVLQRALALLVPRLGADTPRVRQTEEALALVSGTAVFAQE
ncbi:MAG TPA: toll/interleukin-1 receptor domain-containing protein [Thermoanaerobaculia bacterium]|nr:toll/interleukin-1 receptor domain-containing protein [Thermoanaerobaculia bacterium]